MTWTRTFTTLVVLTVTGTLLAAPTAQASPPDASAGTAERAGGRGYHQPERGECHLLSKKQAFALSDSRRPVPCDTKHTLRTVAVKRLSGSPNWNDVGSYEGQFERKCYRAKARALGGNDKVWQLSAYGLYFFIPTQKERRRGATWVRCDVGLPGGRKIVPLPDELKLGRLPLADRVALCRDQDFVFLSCARPHQWRAVGSSPVSDPTPETREEEVAVARRACRGKVTTSRFSWSFPSFADLLAGSKRLVCFNQTRR